MGILRILTLACALGLPALFLLVPSRTHSANNGDEDFAKGWNLLKLQKYQEARVAMERGMKKNPSNALAHFYLAEACRGLKDWACMEKHYETSLELDAGLPTQPTWQLPA